MSLCQRADGRYIVRYKQNGAWKQKSFRDEAQARAFDQEQSDALCNADRLTVLEAVVAFLRSVKHNPKLVTAYRRLLLKSYAVSLKDRYCDTLTRRDLEALREACRAGNCSNATINWYVSMIEAALNWCADQDLIQSNPWAKYRNLTCRHRHLTGTLEDLRKIYPLLRPWAQWAVKTAIALCLRPGRAELFSLRWSAFRWAENCVEVFMPKVRASKRVYPPAAYMEEAATRMANAAAEDFVCPCPQGKQTGEGFRQAWRIACRRAGVVGVPPYALRHIAASQMLAGGADLAAVAAQLGHRDITTTGKHYVHAVSGAQRRAAECLPDLVHFAPLVQIN